MTYRCTMDDGVLVDVKSTSAAEAMQTALERHLGHRVVSCFAGTELGRNPGIIKFEVPRHKPMMAAHKKKKRVKKAERTEKAAYWIEDFFSSKQKQNENPPP